MDLVESLRGFCAVATERSFTRGADRCGLPQPVVSRRVAALERRLGAVLLIRTSRRVALTADGERLLPLATELLGRADRIEALFGGDAGLLLAVPPGLNAPARAAIRRGLAEQTTVTFLDLDPPGRSEALSSGRVRLALLPVAADEAEVEVPLGIGHHDHRPVPRMHLDQLRRPIRDRASAPRALHLLAEDDVPAVRDRVRQACFAAGLRADQVLVGTPATEAWTRVHERGDVVLASAAEAAREQVGWSRLASPGVSRSYRLRGDVLAGGGRSPRLAAGDRSAVLSRLADGLDGSVLRPERPVGSRAC